MTTSANGKTVFVAGGAIAQHAQLGGTGVRHVDDTSVMERPAIIHTDDDLAAIVEVGHLDITR